MFDGNVESIKLFFSAAVAAGVSLIGASFKYIVVLIALMAVDTAFGWVKGKKNGVWSSDIARWGFAGKIIELIFVGMLYMLDWTFSTDFLKYAGIFYFGICEIASMVENYSDINGNLPDGVSDLIKKIKFSIGTSIIAAAKKFAGNFTDSEGKKND